MLEKSKTTNASLLLIDMEDSVHLEMKEEARKMTRRYIQAQHLDSKLKEITEAMAPSTFIFPRVNDISTGMFTEDITKLVTEETKHLVHGFLVCKTNTTKDYQEMDLVLQDLEKSVGVPTNTYKLIFLIETPEGFTNMKEIFTGKLNLRG